MNLGDGHKQSQVIVIKTISDKLQFQHFAIPSELHGSRYLELMPVNGINRDVMFCLMKSIH